MFATHDPRLIAIAADRAARARQDASSSSRCCTASGPTSSAGSPPPGHTVRVYVPYGAQWYGYLMRRLAERPANLAFFARALVSKG